MTVNRADRGGLARLAADLRLSCMRISRRVRFESAAEQLPPHHFSVLARLDAAAGRSMTPGQLADVERVSAPSMTRTIAALVEAGLAERTAHPQDGRQVLVHLTGRGSDELETIRTRRDLWMATRLARLEPAELELLRRAEPVLAKVAAL